MLDFILSSPGLKNSKFSNSVDNNLMFTSTCMFSLNGSGMSITTGKIVINGDAKKSVYEA